MSMELFEKFKEDKTKLKGMVRITEYDQELDADVVRIEYEGKIVSITRDELEIKPVRHSLVNYIGEEIEFQIVEINEEFEQVIGSAKRFKEEQLDRLAEELEGGAVKEAVVTKVLNYGAYLTIDGLSVQMLNKEFSEDYTTIRDVLKEGDTIEVIFSTYTQSKNLRVQAKEKHESDSVMNFEVLKPNQVVLGLVRNVKPWGAYVCVAPNLDALCPIPPNMDVEEGDKVTFKITQVRTDEKRVRGKIIKKIQH